MLLFPFFICVTMFGYKTKALYFILMIKPQARTSLTTFAHVSSYFSNAFYSMFIQLFQRRTLYMKRVCTTRFLFIRKRDLE